MKYFIKRKVYRIHFNVEKKKISMYHEGWQRYMCSEFDSFDDAFNFIKNCETHIDNQNGKFRMEYKILAREYKPDPDGFTRLQRSYLNLLQSKIDMGF